MVNTAFPSLILILYPLIDQFSLDKTMDHISNMHCTMYYLAIPIAVSVNRLFVKSAYKVDFLWDKCPLFIRFS